MQCPKCQHENPGEARFCMKCATELGQSAGTTEAETMTPEGETWRSYDVTDGLPSGARCLFQDVAGYLWIGTWGGVSVYDGDKFTTYTTQDGLASNDVSSICCDKQGRLWFGTGGVYSGDGGGVSVYDGEKFVSYTTQDGLAGNTVLSICCDKQGRVWIGTWGGVSVVDGEKFVSYTTQDGLAHNTVEAIGCDKQGRVWLGTLGGVSVYDGEKFTTQDGLADRYVSSICCDKQGRLWFGTGGVYGGPGAGVSVYDGEKFTTQDGLAGRYVSSICCDEQGRLWFGTYGGVSVVDGDKFTTYTTQDGLLDNRIHGLLEDKEGRLWFAQPHGGVSCLDNSTFQRITQTPVSEVLIQDRKGGFWFNNDNLLCGLSGERQHQKAFNRKVYSLLEDSDGALWIGTMYDGLYRYDSSESVWDSIPQRFTREDGLSDNWILVLLQARDGTLWMGTRGSPHVASGLCRFDGERFQSIPTPHPVVFRLVEDSRGRLWFGGWLGGGLSCYDGEHLTTYTMADGLVDDRVQSIVEDDAGQLWIGTRAGLCCFDGRHFVSYATEEELSSLDHQCSARDIQGHLWFGTNGGGVYRYDGKHFQQLTTKDGLPSNGITALVPQVDGSMIIGTHRGIVCYRSTATVPPGIEIRHVDADRVYPNPTTLELNTTQADSLTIAYHGLSLSTQKMRYSYRLEGYDQDWTDTWESSVRYEALPEGEYRFSVLAINRDLVESEQAASLELTIVPDPRDQQIAQLESDLERRNRELETLNSELHTVNVELETVNAELSAELQDARQIQMSLMPTQAPAIDGAEIAGRCVTANTVGGDFFSYLPGGSNHEIGLVMADVSGHAMKGAMNAVMTDGILHMAVKEKGSRSPAELLQEVNDVLSFRMESDMNVTMVIALLDTGSTGERPVAPTLTLANAGHHAHPLLVRDGVGAVREPPLQLRARGLPLGMKAGVEYREETFDLQSGDILVLMTDGIIEAHDADGRMYGDSGRLERVLLGLPSDMVAEAMVDALIQDAIDYAGGNREDDATVIVVKMRS